MFLRNLSRHVVVSSILLAVAAVWSNALLPSASANEKGKSPEIEGQLLAVDATTGMVTINVRSTVVMVTATRNTKIERNGRRTMLINLRLGDWVEVRLAAGSGNIATKIEAVGP